MKKTGISVIVSVMLLLPGTVYVQAQKGENLVGDYLGFVEQVMKKKHEQAMQNFIQERQQAAEADAKQLREFYLDKLIEAKKNVDAYQKDYLLQLEDTKADLEKRDLKKYEQQIAEELQHKIGQDVEDYLEEILSEK